MDTPLILPPKFYELDSFRYSIQDNFKNIPRLIGDDSITNDMLANDAVGTDQIADDAVTAAKVADTSSTAPTLLNSWVDYGSFEGAGYRKLPGGLVVLEGLIKDGTTTAGTVIFTLPVGNRPAATVVFSVASSTGTARIDVQADGDVVTGTGMSASFTSLNGITFYAS